MLNVIVDQEASVGTAEVLLRLSPGWEKATEEVVIVRVGGGEFSRSFDYITFHRNGTLDTESIRTAVEAPEQHFRSLAEQWRRETGMFSSVSRMAMHIAYQRIIGMGARAIVPILLDLQQRPDHWFWALNAITGENPVPQESAGNLREMAKAWIQWGRRRGYVP
jgi:hypothetical protein